MNKFLASAAIVAVVAIGVPIASAASASAAPAITFVAPSPAEGVTLTTNSVGFGFTYVKKPNATGTLSCVLAGPTASSGACDAPVAFGAKGSQSGASYSGLANGDYTLTVSLTLTDGGTGSVTRHFTVNVPTPTFQSTCESYGGTYGTGGAIAGFAVTDRCDWASVAVATFTGAIDALWPFCPGYPDPNTRPKNQRGAGDPTDAAAGCRNFS